MNTITINRNDICAIPFTITDTANGLAGKRVTFAIKAANTASSLVKKASGLGASSTDVTVTSQTAGQIQGTVNMKATDYATLTAARYYASLWIDDGAGNDRCVTDGGEILLVINDTAPRT